MNVSVCVCLLVRGCVYFRSLCCSQEQVGGVRTDFAAAASQSLSNHAAAWLTTAVVVLVFKVAKTPLSTACVRSSPAHSHCTLCVPFLSAPTRHQWPGHSFRQMERARKIVLATRRVRQRAHTQHKRERPVEKAHECPFLGEKSRENRVSRTSSLKNTPKGVLTFSPKGVLTFLSFSFGRVLCARTNQRQQQPQIMKIEVPITYLSTSMNTWISSIITNRSSDRYSEHSTWVS